MGVSSDKEGQDVKLAQPSPPAKPSKKRKRTNRYQNASPSVLSVSIAIFASPFHQGYLCNEPYSSQRRRAQNRASQRAYRARKDQLIHDLESKLVDAREQTEQLAMAYAELHAQYAGLKAACTGTVDDGLIWAPIESLSSRESFSPHTLGVVPQSES
jgi:hypothetical protein